MNYYGLWRRANAGAVTSVTKKSRSNHESGSDPDFLVLAALEVPAIPGIAGPALLDELLLLEGEGALAGGGIDGHAEGEAHADADTAASAAAEHADAHRRPVRADRRFL